MRSHIKCHGLLRPELFGFVRQIAWEEHKRTGKPHGSWWSVKQGRIVLCDEYDEKENKDEV